MSRGAQSFNRWPLPMWNLRWIAHDGVRRDLVVGTLLGTCLGFYFSQSTNWKEGAWKVGLPFIACVTIQLSIGFFRLAVLIERINKQKHGGLKILAGVLILPILLVAAMFFPYVGLVIALALLVLRLATLGAREDAALLINAAIVWVLWFVIAAVLFQWAWVCIGLTALVGFLMASTSLDLGYRLTRWLNALRESTTLVFGVVLAGLSVARTAAMLSVSGPSPSHLQSTGSSRGVDTLMTSTRGVNSVGRVDIIPVRGYVRSVPTSHLLGDKSHVFGTATQYVAPHVRTLPDGILENNLSYRPPVEDILGTPKVTSAMNTPVTASSLASGGTAGELAIPLLLICQGIESFNAPSDPRIQADFRLRRWGRFWQFSDWVTDWTI